jgi:hypothetical protein
MPSRVETRVVNNVCHQDSNARGCTDHHLQQNWEVLQQGQEGRFFFSRNDLKIYLGLLEASKICAGSIAVFLIPKDVFVNHIDPFGYTASKYVA